MEQPADEPDRRCSHLRCRIHAQYKKPSPVQPGDLEVAEHLGNDGAQKVAAEFWTRTLQAGDITRSRIQATSTIISGITGTFVGAAVLARMQELGSATKFTGITSAILWLLATLLYLCGIFSHGNYETKVNCKKSNIEEPSSDDEEWDHIEIAEHGISQSQTLRARVLWWSLLGNTIAFVAAIFTTMTLIFILTTNNSDYIKVKVLLSQSSLLSGEPECAKGEREITGETDRRGLEKQFLNIRKAKVGKCENEIEILVRRDYVISLLIER